MSTWLNWICLLDGTLSFIHCLFKKCAATSSSWQQWRWLHIVAVSTHVLNFLNARIFSSKMKEFDCIQRELHDMITADVNKEIVLRIMFCMFYYACSQYWQRSRINVIRSFQLRLYYNRNIKRISLNRSFEIIIGLL